MYLQSLSSALSCSAMAAQHERTVDMFKFGRRFEAIPFRYCIESKFISLMSFVVYSLTVE